MWVFVLKRILVLVVLMGFSSITFASKASKPIRSFLKGTKWVNNKSIETVGGFFPDTPPWV
jgi:hypothetical protein